MHRPWLAVYCALILPGTEARAEPTRSDRSALEKVEADLASGETQRALRKLTRALTQPGASAPELWALYGELKAPCATDRVLHPSAAERVAEGRVWQNFPVLAPDALEENEVLRRSVLHHGVFHAKVGQTGQALATLEPALRRGDQESVNCLRQVAAQAVAQQRLGEAQASLERARALLPEEHALPRELGLVLLARGNPEAAREQFEAALEVDPQDLTLRRDLAYALSSAGRASEGHAVLSAEQARCEQTEGCVLELSRWAFEAGLADVAEPSARALTPKEPKNLEAWLLLGEITSRNGDLEAARAAYAEVLKLAPNHARAREASKALRGK